MKSTDKCFSLKLKNETLEVKVASIFFVVGVFMSLVSFTVNSLVGMSFVENIPTLMTLALSLIFPKIWKKRIFLLLISSYVFYAYVPYLFFMMGGTTGAMPMYFIVSVILLAFMYEKIWRIVMVAIAVIIYIALFIIERLFPRLVVAYPNENLRSFDFCVSLVFSTLVCTLFAAAIVKIYKSEREKASTALRAKNLFFANMSHEIRTPMNAVIGISELMLYEDLNEKQRKYAEDIHNSSTSLLGIINDILDISKIEEGKFTLSQVNYDFLSLLDNVELLMNIIIKSKDIDFLVEKPDNLPRCLFGDEIRLRQVLINLLGNAVKFTQEGFVRLVITMSDNKMKFEIKDTGTGIKQEDMKYLFQIYSQISVSHSRELRGTGLGLSITKSIIETMGGRIWAESEYGMGSTFSFEIPVTFGDESLISDKRSFEYIRVPGARILLVDDNAVNLVVGCGILSLCQADTDTAVSGWQAIEMIKKECYDLILLDHIMPEMDGIETAAAIRALGDEYANLPIIALTANAATGSRELYLQNGINDYLSKPIDKLELNRILFKWINHKVDGSFGKVKPEKEYKPDSETVKKRHLSSEFVKKLSTMNVLNIEKGLTLCAWDHELYEQVTRTFVLTAECMRNRLLSVLEAGDLENFAIEIHGLRGAMLGIGAQRQASTAEQLEQYAHLGELKICKDAFISFLNDFEILIDKLKQATEISSQVTGTKMELMAQLTDLEVALDEFDTPKVSAISLYLIKKNFGRIYDRDLQRMYEVIIDFDYDRASRIIEKLKGRLTRMH